ncbi:type IV secretory system conjugative DNA transfer family protein [Hahella ganghwensis]|uniref:type IV secretory system conjugative DNA transfer family protein n=1 Tax=Hahella ganghwensis TaxID=286420 RepID=UPI00037F84CE|nr:type IV secretory system conjugative DNA transfer family protein [Hahella ganghwensis]
MNAKFNNAVGPQVRAKKTKKSKVLPLLGGASLVAGLQAATQFFAYKFNYQETLGSNLNHLYTPWSILRWSNDWFSHYPDEFMQAGSLGMMVSTVGLLGVAIAKVVAANSTQPNEYLHGSARWANMLDIISAGLLPRKRTTLEIVTGKDRPASEGVYVGGWEDKSGNFHYLRHNGPEHVLTYAPTRSGKGVGLVIPTLLSWPASCVITDLKGELWALTAGWRKKHAKNKVVRFEPAALNGSVRWNPLDEIRLGTEHEVGDVQDLATLIVDPAGKGLDSHWDKTAFSLLTGVILHVLYKAKHEGTPASLPEVDRVLADPDRDVGELWMEMATYAHVDGHNHPTVGASARDMMDRPDEEGGSVLSTAKSHLSLYRDPVVSHNISKSEFRIKDLMNDDDPVSLYIVTQPTAKARMRPLVRLLVNMIVRLLADKIEFERALKEMPPWRKFLSKLGFPQVAETYVRSKKGYKHRLLGMFDEFPSLGKLEIVQESLAFVAGYGLKFYLICQDINQLKSRELGYGPDEVITSNCHVQNAYPPNRVETAEHLSKLTGTTTVQKKAVTVSGRRTSAMLGQVSSTIQEVQRPLLTPDECLRMPGPVKDGEQIKEPGDMVVYVAGYPAIYGRQPLFFKDPVFAARAAVPNPTVSDKTRVVQDDEERITI